MVDYLGRGRGRADSSHRSRSGRRTGPEGSAIDFEVKITGEDVGLFQVLERLKDFKPILRKAAATILNNPANRTRPDRWQGRKGRAGEIASWAPGYEDHVRAAIRKRRIQEKSSRPFVPILTDRAEAELAELTASFVLGSDDGVGR